MFLISWSGYWQKFIEIISWAHEQPLISNGVLFIRGIKQLPFLLFRQNWLVKLILVSITYFLMGYLLFYQLSEDLLKLNLPPRNKASMACFIFMK